MEKILDENIMLEIQKSTAASLGVSPSYLSRLKSRERPITVQIAEQLNYDVLVSFVKRPPPQPADAQAVIRYPACGHIRYVGGPSDTGGDKCHDCAIDDVVTSGGKL